MSKYPRNSESAKLDYEPTTEHEIGDKWLNTDPVKNDMNPSKDGIPTGDPWAILDEPKYTPKHGA